MTVPSWMQLAFVTPGEPVARLERVLAVGRAFLTVTALTAIYLDPTEPARLAALTYGVLASYALYSLLVLAFVHRARHLTRRHGIALHGMDMLWTSALTFVSEGPVSPFFLFFLFVVLAAAYRWAFGGTLITTGLTIVVFLIQTSIAAAGPWRQNWLPLDVEWSRAVLRVAYLLLTGFLLGYLAEQDKRSRRELASIAELTREPSVELGLGGSIGAVARGLLRTFEASRVCFVLQDFESHETHLWQVDRSWLTRVGDPPRLELTAGQRTEWLFPDPGRVWDAAPAPAERTWRVRVVDADVWPLRREWSALPEAILASGPFQRVFAANLGLADEWRGRVYIFDPTTRGSAEQLLHFLDALAEHVAPAITNVFLLNRLRARATAAERARVARELHDGAIQALYGIDMKVEALQRGATPLPATVATELAHVQHLLRREVLELRELMQALRPIPLDTAEQLPDVLASVVERFRRDTGVPARFVHNNRAVRLPPATALEVVRIVQEALVNVRKHSRARNVLIRLTGDDGGCTVVVEDDGVGFDFEGLLSGEELERQRVGPAVIKERARMAGATLAIESTPGVGARIELSLAAPA